MKKAKPLDVQKIKQTQQRWAKAEAKCKDMRDLEDEAYKKHFPKSLKAYKAAPKVDKGVWGDFFPEGLRDTEIGLVDSAGQKLDFRVGPVFGRERPYKEPGIWIGYQRRWYSSSRQGDLLISPELWRRLNKEMERRFKRFDARDYGPSKVPSAKKKAKS
jgi:hypothetical protein